MGVQGLFILCAYVQLAKSRLDMPLQSFHLWHEGGKAVYWMHSTLHA